MSKEMIERFRSCPSSTECKKMATELAALRASAVAEPVAWRWRSVFNDSSWCYGPVEPTFHDQYITEPLYAHPAPAAPVAEDTPETVATELAYFDAHADRFAEAHRGLSAPVPASVKEALEPFARCVYNDNGDVTLTTSHLRIWDYMRAERALASLPAPEAAPTREKPTTGEDYSNVLTKAINILLGPDLDDGQRGKERE